jgi:hypothetical protein
MGSARGRTVTTEYEGSAWADPWLWVVRLGALACNHPTCHQTNACRGRSPISRCRRVPPAAQHEGRNGGVLEEEIGHCVRLACGRDDLWIGQRVTKDVRKRYNSHAADQAHYSPRGEHEGRGGTYRPDLWLLGILPLLEGRQQVVHEVVVPAHKRGKDGWLGAARDDDAISSRSHHVHDAHVLLLQPAPNQVIPAPHSATHQQVRGRRSSEGYEDER